MTVAEMVYRYQREGEDLTERVSAWRQNVEADFPTPDLRDSADFLVSEVGELLDLIIRYTTQGKYLRGRQVAVTRDRLLGEVGDCLLMLATVANHLGVTFDEALQAATEKVERRIG